MKIVDFYDKYSTPLAITLGFFDCIHSGHKNLVLEALSCAKNNVNGARECALMTFSNDPNDVLAKSKQIYEFADRCHVLENLNLDVVIGAKFDYDFANLTPQAFLDALTTNFNIRVIIVGADYTFGKNAHGNVEFLREYCNLKGITLLILPFETVGGVKLSTRNLKSLVENGDVEILNSMLSEPYFIRGDVKHARHAGTGMGFPTVNIAVPIERLPLKDGIYATKIQIDGVWYNSMTNVGAKPTFGVDALSIETYIFDFDEDVYGKSVKVQFFKRTRDVQKFGSIDALKNQLSHDEQQIRQYFGCKQHRLQLNE